MNAFFYCATWIRLHPSIPSYTPFHPHSFEQWQLQRGNSFSCANKPFDVLALDGESSGGENFTSRCFTSIAAIFLVSSSTPWVLNGKGRNVWFLNIFWMNIWWWFRHMYDSLGSLSSLWKHDRSTRTARGRFVNLSNCNSKLDGWSIFGEHIQSQTLSTYLYIIKDLNDDRNF